MKKNLNNVSNNPEADLKKPHTLHTVFIVSILQAHLIWTPARGDVNIHCKVTKCKIKWAFGH